MPADVLATEVAKAQAGTDKPFGVNLMLLADNVDELMQVVIDAKVPVVTTGAGNPGVYMDSLKAAGIKVLPIAPSTALAKRLETVGADAIIGEGMEAGGHIGDLTTMVLTPQLVDAVDVPVVAAGGIADGRAIAAAFALGAEGVQVGTRFMCADECEIHDDVKQRIITAKDRDTVIIGTLDRPSGARAQEQAHPADPGARQARRHRRDRGSAAQASSLLRCAMATSSTGASWQVKPPPWSTAFSRPPRSFKSS